MNLIESFINNPVKVTVGVLLVALFGVVALERMPMQLTPEVQTPTITVETRWPGASPQEIEREITLEQEEQLKSVEGLKKMSSESSDSLSRVSLEFLVGTDMDEALLKVMSQKVGAFSSGGRRGPGRNLDHRIEYTIIWKSEPYHARGMFREL